MRWKHVSRMSTKSIDDIWNALARLVNRDALDHPAEFLAFCRSELERIERIHRAEDRARFCISSRWRHSSIAAACKMLRTATRGCRKFLLRAAKDLVAELPALERDQGFWSREVALCVILGELDYAHIGISNDEILAKVA